LSTGNRPIDDIRFHDYVINIHRADYPLRSEKGGIHAVALMPAFVDMIPRSRTSERARPISSKRRFQKTVGVFLIRVGLHEKFC
jgi:hypothetical protein